MEGCVLNSLGRSLLLFYPWGYLSLLSLQLILLAVVELFGSE